MDDKASEEYQSTLYSNPMRCYLWKCNFNLPLTHHTIEMTWTALKKSINGLINKVNVSNIKSIVAELFAENLVRGRYERDVTVNKIK